MAGEGLRDGKGTYHHQSNGHQVMVIKPLL